MERFSLIDQMSKGTRAYIILFCLTFFTTLPGVFNMPALDRDESRFAQASKQMLETEDYIIIRYQDGQRNKKPAGIHWLQAGATAIFAGDDQTQIWTYRLPSWLGVSLAICATFWAGIPLIGRRAAFLGCLLFSTSLLLTSEGHISKTDGVLVAITTLGVGAFLYLRQSEHRAKWFSMLFWFAMGFGFLIKGPITPMVAFLAIICTSLWGRGWKWPVAVCAGIALIFLDTYLPLGPASFVGGLLIKGAGGVILAACGVRFVLDQKDEDWFRVLFWWPGPVLFVLMVLPWFIWIQMATGGQFVEGAVGKDLKDKVVGASEGHGGPPGYHLIFLLLMFFPTSLFVVPSLTKLGADIRAKVPDAAGLVFLLWWLVPTWVVFEFLPTKLSHYILPAYPALGLICGYGLLKLIEGARLPVSRAVSVVIFLIGGGLIAAIASPAGLDYFMKDAADGFKSVEPATVLAAWADVKLVVWPLIIIVASLLLCVFYSVARKYQFALACLIVCGVATGWHMRTTLLPQQTWILATTAARTALADVCALPGEDGCDPVSPTQIQTIGYAEPSFVFTTGTEVRISPQSTPYLPPAEQAPVMAWVINLEDTELGPPALDVIKGQAADQGRCLRESSPVYAYNYSNGDPVHFVAVLVEAGPCRV